MSVDWLPWSAAAFMRARTERKPVLLSIVTWWCGHCAEMDRTTYLDARVVELVRDRFVPVRVDADRRPDISTRYTLGGWPTTAFLTADGDLLGGGTIVSADRLAAILTQAADTYAARGGEFGETNQTSAVAAASPGGPAQLPDETLVQRLFDAFNRDTGTFGEAAFPQPACIQVAMDLFRREARPEAGDIAVAALDALGWGGLYDDRDGGFHRCASGPGWSEPQEEKLLEVNAALLSLYLEAFETFGLARYRDRALDVITFVQAELADAADGAWGAAVVGRTVDSTRYTDANGAMVSAMLHASRVLDDAALGEFAIRSLERVVLESYRPGGGVAHYVDAQPQGRGLLDDQVSMIRAHADAFEATGNIVYEMMAEELAHYVIRVLGAAAGGGFFDRIAEADDIGLLRRRMQPFVANCDAARAFGRVAATSGDSDFLDTARTTLAAIAPSAADQGPHAASYLLALREVRRG
jgi:uncharacterized protein